MHQQAEIHMVDVSVKLVGLPGRVQTYRGEDPNRGVELCSKRGHPAGSTSSHAFQAVVAVAVDGGWIL